MTLPKKGLLAAWSDSDIERHWGTVYVAAVLARAAYFVNHQLDDAIANYLGYSKSSWVYIVTPSTYVNNVLFLSDDDGTIVVFDGTRYPGQIAYYIFVSAMCDFPEVNSYAHAAFLALFRSVLPYLLDQIAKANAWFKPITFIGHSMGAAVARLAAVYFRLFKGMTVRNVFCFESPVVGSDGDLTKDFLGLTPFNQLEEAKRPIFVRRWGDMVPYVPPPVNDNYFTKPTGQAPAGLFGYHPNDPQWVFHDDSPPAQEFENQQDGVCRFAIGVAYCGISDVMTDISSYFWHLLGADRNQPHPAQLPNATAQLERFTTLHYTTSVLQLIRAEAERTGTLLTEDADKLADIERAMDQVDLRNVNAAQAQAVDLNWLLPYATYPPATGPVEPPLALAAPQEVIRYVLDETFASSSALSTDFGGWAIGLAVPEELIKLFAGLPVPATALGPSNRTFWLFRGRDRRILQMAQRVLAAIAKRDQAVALERRTTGASNRTPIIDPGDADLVAAWQVLVDQIDYALGLEWLD